MNENLAAGTAGQAPSAPSAPAGGGPQQHRVALAERRRQRRWVPATAALLCMLIGLSDVLAIFEPEWYETLHKINAYVPGTLTNVARSAEVIVGLLLLMLSHGLRRRKRRAWQAVVALLAFDVIIHFLHSAHHLSVHLPAHHLPTVAVSLALLAALLCFRHDFYAVGDPRTRWTALWAFIGLAAADLAIGLGYLSGAGLAGSYTLFERVQDVVYEVLGISGPVMFRSEFRADTYHLLTSALGLFTLVVTVYLFLRPAEPKARLSEADAKRIRQLLARHGDRDSLGYFALRDDKSVIWSPTGKSCVCYRVVSGVMLASGDPIGDPEAWPGAIHAFLSEAARHAWAPAVMGCSELGAEIWCREGDLTALELGDEGIVNIADFSLSGRAMRNVRQMVSRVARNGYTAQVRRVGDIPREEIRAILEAAESWRGSQMERGFSMALGRIGARGDERCVLATATRDGGLRAVLHFVPWGSDGLSLDLMRRDKGSQPGLNDFLIVETIKAAPSLGVKRISLNFAVFRSALERGERIGAGPVLRAWRSILLFLSKWFQIESLYKFNAKFCPAWEPRFFVFPGTKDAPRIALAALEAEAFLVWPRIELRRIARAAGLGRVRRFARKLRQYQSRRVLPGRVLPGRVLPRRAQPGGIRRPRG
ncbi:MAG TPA: phosphatidylglycerol lysyltransferase domain-containing protein [Streptosporangiaceae bacterium]|nr:phosphatidylglycerol lysyltransferase domain-containing protein [Streptosporangiaceae bacterium]